MTISWYALWLGMPKAEFEAERAIKKLGHESFVPVEFKWAARNARTKLKVRRAYPLVLRYAFVGFNGDNPQWPTLCEDSRDLPVKVVKNTRIPIRVLGMGGKPARLDNEQIGILASLSALTLPYATSINPHKAILSVKAGDQARVIDGAFFGHFGRVDRVTAERARVIIQILGSYRPVDVPITSLEAA